MMYLSTLIEILKNSFQKEYIGINSLILQLVTDKNLTEIVNLNQFNHYSEMNKSYIKQCFNFKLN